MHAMLELSQYADYDALAGVGIVLLALIAKFFLPQGNRVENSGS